MKKTRFHYLLLSFLIAMTSWQCNGTASDQSNNAVTTSDPVEKEVVTDKNRIALRVRVDNLRMRSGPGMDAEVIEKLPENTRLTDLGEASKEMAEVMLRGVKHKAPWMKVRTSSGKEGWVFGGAVTPVQAGTSSTAGEAAPFSAYLKKLKQRNCTNLAAAKAALIKRLKANPGTQDSDESIAAFHKFYEETVEKANGFEPMGKDEQAFALLVYNPDKKPLPKHVAAKAKEWKACGIALEYPEGMLYLVESPDYMVQNFAHLASPPMKKYLLQRQIELKEGFSEDAGLLITPQKLAERLAFWDQF
ncbi:MAG TPA: SH3 domain-containing protein, partial [Bacteroidetes bacterium]|nr:SH3 domain-containing protein [Bacteroidota bacterium]